MAEIVKPIITEDTIWSTQGEKIPPTAEKIRTGWGREMMPAEWQNWSVNRQDQGLAYLFQMGIPQWDALTNYVANKSVVMYNGTIYLATADNTNVEPTTNNSSSWYRFLDRNTTAVLKTNDNGVAEIPSGTTGQRPNRNFPGDFRFNTTTKFLEFNDGTGWRENLTIDKLNEFAGSLGNIVPDAVIAENAVYSPVSTVKNNTPNSLNAVNAQLTALTNRTDFLLANSGGGGGGMEGLASAVNTTAPNNVKPAVIMTPTDTVGVNVDLVLSPRGNGALQAQVANDGVEGGNKRGTFAVDFSQSRLFANCVASGNYSVVGGGYSSKASGNYSVVVGGNINYATGTESGVVTGQGNMAIGVRSFVGGGINNQAQSEESSVLGGSGNVAVGYRTTVLGGMNNSAHGEASVVIAGGANINTGAYSTIGSGSQNRITETAHSGFIGAGTGNQVSNQRSFVGAGANNYATGPNSSVINGQNNKALGSNSAILNGQSNQASGFCDAIIGGEGNSTTGSANYGVIIGGYGSISDGQCATVLNGFYNRAASNYSLVSGEHANSRANPRARIHGAGSFKFFDGNVGHGVAQLGTYTLIGVTSGSTDTKLFTGISDNTYGISMPTLSTWIVKVHVIAQSPNNYVSAWEITAVVKRGTGLCTISGTPTKTTIVTEAGALGVNLVVDESIGSFNIVANSGGLADIHWLAKIETVELKTATSE